MGGGGGGGEDGEERERGGCTQIYIITCYLASVSVSIIKSLNT